MVMFKGFGFPDSVRTSLKYVDTFRFGPAGTSGVYVYRGNSLYDPDYTSVGHQPRYFDNYAAVYSKYKVLGSTFNVKMMNIAGDPSLLALIPLTDVLINPTSPYQLMELPRAKWTKCLPIIGRNAPPDLTSSYTTSQILGLKGGQINDEDYSARVNSDPSSIWYWNLFLARIAGSGVTTPGCDLIIEIDYDCIFYDRSEVSPSLVVKDPEVNHNKQNRDDEPDTPSFNYDKAII
jgi:hypothetical protein